MRQELAWLNVIMNHNRLVSEKSVKASTLQGGVAFISMDSMLEARNWSIISKRVYDWARRPHLEVVYGWARLVPHELYRLPAGVKFTLEPFPSTDL